MFMVHNVYAGIVMKSAPVTGLSAYWPFDSKTINWSGGSAFDVSGSGNTATLVSMTPSVNQTSGKVGQAVFFDGNTTYMTLAHNPISNVANPSSACAWVNTKDINFNPGGGLNQTFLNLYTDSSNGMDIGSIVGSGALFASYKLGGNLLGAQSTGSVFSNNNWVHVCYVWNGSGVALYANGLSLATTTDVDSIGPANLIGARDLFNDGTWLGSVDDLRIYNRALSPNEVLRIYQGGSLIFNSSPSRKVVLESTPKNFLANGLVGYWSFNGQDLNWSTNTAIDRSGQGNNGTLTNMSTNTSPVPGKMGQALSFNGTNSYVDVADATPLNPTTAVSLSSWVKTTTAGGYIIAKDPSTASTSPGTMATSSASGGTTDWTTPNNAEAEDGALASTRVGQISPCLAPDTLISTQEGSKAIKDLKIGDLIQSYNPATEKTEIKKVSDVSSRPISNAGNKYYHIYFNGGDIRATYNHIFYVNGEQKMAEDLKVGDELFGIQGNNQTITNIIIEENFTDNVWDISVNDNHNFFANGVLVHNSGIYDYRVLIIKGGTVSSTSNNRANSNAWPNSLAYTTYGSSSDQWGESWTPAQINSSDFGVAISAYGSGYDSILTSYYLKATNFGFSIPTDATVNGITVEIKKKYHSAVGYGIGNYYADIDHVRITVNYTPATGKTNMPYALSTVNGGEFLIESGGTNYTVDSSTNVADGKWHFMSATYNGNAMGIYVDGVQTGSSTSFSGSLPTVAGNVRVGADYQSTPASFFNGKLDDVRIYNRALSAAEVRQLYLLGR
jgi:hypothetical protein